MGKRKATTMKNVAGKTRHINNPYASWTDPTTGWQYKLLKSWQADNSKTHARWFMDVLGFAHDMGDEYCYNMRSSLNRAINAGTLTVDSTIWEVDEYGYSGQFAAWAWGER
jgi:hypothetical protein